MIERSTPWNGNLFGGMLLSYLTAFGLWGALFLFGDAWYILANSRILSLFIGAGLVRYHDRHAGFVDGIPEVEMYMLAKDPVNWTIALLAFVLILAYWGARSWQFHGFARAAGVAGNLGQHTRAFLYGTGIGHLMPFGGGTLATGEALATTPEHAAETHALDQAFKGLEIVFFGLISLVLIGWNPWFKQLGSTAIFLACISAIVYGGVRAPFRAYVQSMMTTLRSLPFSTLVALFALSVVSFQLIDWASYFVAQAFTTVNVLVGVEAEVMTMAIVCGYLARAVPLTPGGIGQFEWGLALGIWFGGSSLPQAATVALLITIFRLLAILLLTLAVRFFFPVNTSLRSALRLLSGAPA